MAITASDVKTLREMTGVGMMDCKKALTEAEGDLDRAVEILREKGIASAAKKGGRIAAEGVVGSFIAQDAKAGAIIEINCETDFVAKTPEFQGFVTDVASQVVNAAPANEEELLAQKCLVNQGMTVAEYVTDRIQKTGENVKVRRFTRYQMDNDGIVESYIHMGGKIGVLIQVSCGNADAAKTPEFNQFVRDIAMHIAASNPLYLKRDEVPAEVLDTERKILREQARNEGKPEKIIDRMVEGRVEKYYKENCLVDQQFVRDTDLTITQVVDAKAKEIGAAVSIDRFARYEMGEGLEKRQDNFADEVAAQAAKM